MATETAAEAKLAEYKRKRDFKKTPEPGPAGPSAQALDCRKLRRLASAH